MSCLFPNQNFFAVAVHKIEPNNCIITKELAKDDFISISHVQKLIDVVLDFWEDNFIVESFLSW